MALSAKKKRALFSLYEEDNAPGFARRLIACGWTIVATKNVTTLLGKHGIEAQDVADFLKTGETYPFPPTLHPQMELALTTDAEESINLVFDTTYPLSEGNDVGGHTLLALAAKGSRIVVSSNDDMEKVLGQIQSSGSLEPEFHEYLIRKTYGKISSHYFSLYKPASNPNGSTKEGEKRIPLKEGENPYQVPADMVATNFNDELSLVNFDRVSGELPCFTNVADWDSMLKILCALSGAFRKNFKKIPNIFIAAKHGNPCGLGVDWQSKKNAVELALFGNPTAVWGGESILNFTVDQVMGQLMLSSERRRALLGNPNWMLDLIAAPQFDADAIKILGKRKERKLFSNSALKEAKCDESEWSYRPVRGGGLQQPPNNYILDFEDCEKSSTFNKINIKESLAVAWVAAWHSNHGGNEVAIAKDGQLLGIGGGPSTIEAAATAVHRAQSCGHDLKDSVFCADAFFPFTDAPEELVGAGCRYGLVPKGGKNFQLVKNFFSEHNVEVGYLPPEIRGFCRH